MVGDNENLISLARKLLQTYDIHDILEYNELDDETVVITLLEAGLINEDMPHVVG